MTTLLQKISEDLEAVNAEEKSSTIFPDELIFQILLRLPAKCVARCRCLSKHWASVLDGQDFTDRYLERSSARNHLLFACKIYDEFFFLSSPPKPQDNNISRERVHYRRSFPLQRDNDTNIPVAINGLICVRDQNRMMWMICNPTTGQSFILPRVNAKEGSNMRSFFGYDPVEKQFKVLSITWTRIRYEAKVISQEYQVLTLQSGELSWRMIECDVPHYPSSSNSACVNGVLYYKADIYGDYYFGDTIMCFDLRSEKYSFLKFSEPLAGPVQHETKLLNYNGKLAAVRPSVGYCFVRETTSFEMWVLDDLEKNEWSMHVYELPPMWRDHVAADTLWRFDGVTSSNEVVLTNHYVYGPFYVFYYSLVTKTMRRVEILGLVGAFSECRVYTFVDHVENIKILKGVLGPLESELARLALQY